MAKANRAIRGSATPDPDESRSSKYDLGRPILDLLNWDQYASEMDEALLKARNCHRMRTVSLNGHPVRVGVWFGSLTWVVNETVLAAHNLPPREDKAPFLGDATHVVVRAMWNEDCLTDWARWVLAEVVPVFEGVKIADLQGYRNLAKGTNQLKIRNKDGKTKSS